MRNPQLSYYSGPLYQDMPTYMGPSAQRGRVFLVAVHGEQLQTRDRGSFDRVHVMVVDPNQMADLSHPLSILCALPDVNRGIPPAISPRNLLAVKSRPVCGEILRNQQGQLYEKRGRQLVPLSHLVSGPQGEVIEFLPPAHPHEWTSTRQVEECLEVDELPEEGDATAEPREQEKIDADRSQPRLAVRKLFPDPGQLRLLTYGDFARTLAPQLRHPERLRESHQVPCYLQVFEVRRPISIQQMASSLEEDVAQLHVLNPWMAEKLGLASLLSRLRRRPTTSRTVLTPSDLVCRLQVVRDPTADLTNTTAPTANEHAAGQVVPAAVAVKRTSIPDGYLKPWELKFSREEVLYDMNSARLPQGIFQKLTRLIRERIRRSDFQRWTALLANKNAEEQLWAVRPPRHGLMNDQIRAWACNALTSAGYDAQTMLAEWEIYWRRKGLR